ncbi:MAG: response regulator transcription factor [Ignavibacteriaceae bacterium]|nr:response regulator transcription factor [Ignavibacteriaceae bacterium]
MSKLLLADDHSLFREGLKQILSKYEKFDVIDEASNSIEAIEKITHDDYDLIILDISMPGPGIFETINQIRSLKPELKILILSMHPEEQYAVRLMKLGAYGYVNKDSAADELVKAINIILTNNKYFSDKVVQAITTTMFNTNDINPEAILSNREFEVMCLIGKGKSLKEIGELLFISEKTVSTYRSRILEKLRLKNNSELIKYVLVNKFID